MPIPTLIEANRRTVMPSRLHLVQNFTLLWLNTYIDVSNLDFKHWLTQLRQIISSTNIFHDVDDCMDCLTEIKHERVFIIVPIDFAKSIVSVTHDMRQLDGIYIFSDNQKTDQEWVKEWPKVKGIFTEIYLLCAELKRNTENSYEDSISISITDVHLNHLEPSFMYAQLLKEILLKTSHDDKQKEEFVAFCREKYHDQPAQMNIINEFEKDNRSLRSIWWYTRNCFIYSMLNNSLRVQEMNIILKMGFFVRDLHREIEHFYVRPQEKLVVYRGQGISNVDFAKMCTRQGSLLSFLNFLSTSIDRQVSLSYAMSSADDPDLVGILFEITIDPTLTIIPYTSTEKMGYFGDAEMEILFSMHSVFRIGQIIQIMDRIWKVELSLASDTDDYELNQLTEYMRKNLRGQTEQHQLATLLCIMGNFHKAEEVYHMMLDQVYKKDEKEFSDIYHQLAWIKENNGDYIEALEFYHKALAISQRILASNHADIAATYQNIAGVHYNMGEYSKALEIHQKALQICEKTLPPNHPKLGRHYNNIGLIYEKIAEYSRALEFYQKCLKIQLETLPPKHPDLAVVYNNIGLMHANIGEYSKALEFYQKSFEIQKRSLPPNHPTLAGNYNNIAMIYCQIGNYRTALTHFQAVIEILKKSLPTNYTNFAVSYSNIAAVHTYMGEYFEALECYHKAIEIYKRFSPVDHPDLATVYNNISVLYISRREYSQALEFSQKGLEIRQRLLPPHHVSLIRSFNNIGLIYHHIGEYRVALQFYQQAVEIHGKLTTPNSLELATEYHNIAEVYSSLGEYSKASEFFQKALEIFKISLPPNHPKLATVYNNMGRMHMSMKEYSKALQFFESSLAIRLQSLPSNHTDIAITYNNIGAAQLNLEHYLDALEFLHKALEIWGKSLLDCHPDLAAVYNHIGLVHFRMGAYTRALTFFERAVDIGQRSLPENHPALQLYQKRLAEVISKL